jgi:hypothetical protein
MKAYGKITINFKRSPNSAVILVRICVLMTVVLMTGTTHEINFYNIGVKFAAFGSYH